MRTFFNPLFLLLNSIYKLGNFDDNLWSNRSVCIIQISHFKNTSCQTVNL